MGAAQSGAGEERAQALIARMQRGRIRDIHKVRKVAHQPGGLKALSDTELDAYVAWLRDGLEAARYKKGRRGWRESLDAAEAELARRTA